MRLETWLPLYVNFDGGSLDPAYDSLPFPSVLSQFFRGKDSITSPFKFYYQLDPSDRASFYEWGDRLRPAKKVGFKFTGWYTNDPYPVFDAQGILTSEAIESLYSSQDTLYAHYDYLAVPITLNHAGGASSISLVYYNVDNGGYYSDIESTQGVAMLPVPTLPGNRFLGYYSAASGGTKYVNADGSFTQALTPSAPITVYAQWQQVSRHITLDRAGGSGGTADLYYRISGGGVYLDEICENVATSIAIPTKAGSRFIGYFSAASGGTKYIDETGVVLSTLSSLAIASDLTIYAHWADLYSITFSKDGGSGGSDGLWYDSSTGKYYSDSTFRIEVTSIAAPTKSGNVFLGYFSAASGGTKYVNADGSFTSDFPTPTQDLTFFAHWDVQAFVLYLDAAGGERAPDRVFYKPGQGWFMDEGCTSAISSIVTPIRSGYTFGGYLSSGTSVVSASGVILVASISADMTATASWSPLSYTLTFDYKGGTSEGVESKTVTMGQPVGGLPTSEKTGRIFGGWKIANLELTATTVWNIASDSTAVANWVGYVGNVVDYFGLANDALLPIASDSGDGRKRVTVSHVGFYELGVEALSSVIWRNPSVTYRVVGDITFNAVLGRAFARNGLITGYMVTEIKIRTSIGEFPTIRVSAVANEGADAINLFPVSVRVLANAHAQNLLSSVNGGGDLQSLALFAKCTPVVVAENMVPCASDVVGGRLTVAASTIASRNEAKPVASGGFVAVGEPRVGEDSCFTTYALTLEKEI